MVCNHKILARKIGKLVEEEPKLEEAGGLEVGSPLAYKKLFEGEDFLSFLQNNNMTIERSELEKYAQACFAKKDYINPVLATVAWGYIGQHVGPCRVFNLWTDVDIQKKLAKIRSCLCENKVKSAFSLATKLDGVGGVFASKILYVLAIGVENINPYPVIIDRRVINSVEKISASLAAEYCRRDGMGNISTSATKYLKYCEDINGASKLLEMSPANFELILFNWNGGGR